MKQVSLKQTPFHTSFQPNNNLLLSASCLLLPSPQDAAPGVHFMPCDPALPVPTPETTALVGLTAALSPSLKGSHVQSVFALPLISILVHLPYHCLSPLPNLSFLLFGTPAVSTNTPASCDFLSLLYVKSKKIALCAAFWRKEDKFPLSSVFTVRSQY